MAQVHQQMRIGDVERDVVVGLLADHFAAGRLSLDEFDQRSDLALSAKTSGELDAVLVDLPGSRRRVRTDRDRSQRKAMAMALAVCSSLLALIVGYEVVNGSAEYATPVCEVFVEPDC